MEFKEEMILGENDFDKGLKNKILPWVKESLEDGYLENKSGHKLHYHYAIHEEEKAMVVFSHGFCEFVSKYHEIMYYFYQMGYSVALMEHRGHGFSFREVEELDKVHVVDYQDYVTDLQEFMDQVVVKISLSKTYYLFAHSMGGCIGTLFLEQHPEYFKKAVLSSPLLQMNFGTVPEWAVNLVVVWSKLRKKDLMYAPGQKGFDGVNVFKTSSCLSESRYNYVFSERLREPHYTSYGGTYSWARASIKGVKRAQRDATKIKVPVLLFQAGLDGMVKPAGQLRFAETCKRVRFVRYDDSKHEIFNALEETRKDYYQRIFSFYEELLQ